MISVSKFKYLERFLPLETDRNVSLKNVRPVSEVNRLEQISKERIEVIEI